MLDSTELAQVLQKATGIARSAGQKLTTAHVLLGLFKAENRAQLLLKERGVDENGLLRLLSSPPSEPDGLVRELREKAREIATNFGAVEADCLHLLVAVTRMRCAAHDLLLLSNLDLSQLRTMVLAFFASGRMPRSLQPERTPQAVGARPTVVRPVGAPPSPLPFSAVAVSLPHTVLGAPPTPLPFAVPSPQVDAPKPSQETSPSASEGRPRSNSLGEAHPTVVTAAGPTKGPAPSPALPGTSRISLPKPVLEAYRASSLALFIGSGLSLGSDVKGNFPTWSQLPHRLLDACERLGALEGKEVQSFRNLFEGHVPLERMLAQLGALRSALARDYPNALDEIFRPSEVASGSAHHAVARLGVRAILTTNYDSLIEDAGGGTLRRYIYTWKDSDKALRDLESGRNVLLKVHGTAEHHESVVMTEHEYRQAHSDPSYQRVLSHLLQRYTFLFLGYGMNDPLDLDLALKGNSDAFKSAARRHYVLMKDPSDNARDRYEREYNVRVIPYSDHAQLPAALEELQSTAVSRSS